MIETSLSFEKIVEQHRELRELIEELRDFLKVPRPGLGETGSHTWASALADRLGRFHDKVFRHFREEERAGFLDELQRENPGATHLLEALKKDHDRILADTRAILTATLTYGEGKKLENPQLRRWTSAVLDQLAQHESEETDLLQRTYCEDLGAGD